MVCGRELGRVDYLQVHGAGDPESNQFAIWFFEPCVRDSEIILSCKFHEQVSVEYLPVLLFLFEVFGTPSEDNQANGVVFVLLPPV